VTEEFMARDLAGQDYWNGIWRRSAGRSIGRFSYFHHAFSQMLARHVRPGATVCEVGCADSVWVPHLIRMGARVTGLDYSEPGLARLRTRLAAEGLEASLLASDLMGPAPFGGATFDVIFSLGLVEHFDEPARAIEAMRDALKPDGLMITMVPNLVGAWGPLQARLDRDVFDRHVPYDTHALDAMHVRSGLTPLERARYLGVFGLTILHRPSLAEKFPRVNRACASAQWIATQAISWPAALLMGRGAESRLLSSHVVGVYQRDRGRPRA
jgi:2-polyprenyl-3-methyl-5-hydroxy-6-metoxy-1,4-benzoquinol methylase